MTRPLTIALLQISPTGTLAGNLAKGILACRRAAELGADIALFPEMWSNGYALHGRPVEDWTAEAVDVDGDFVSAFGELARELNMAIGVTLLERHEGGPRNTLVLFDRFGERRLAYAKVHTCDFDVERHLTPGREFPVCVLDTAVGPVRVGAMICFDREFPESARILMLNGAELILVSNACPMEINRLAQLRARAYENMTAIATCNYPDSMPGATATPPCSTAWRTCPTAPARTDPGICAYCGPTAPRTCSSPSLIWISCGITGNTRCRATPIGIRNSMGCYAAGRSTRRSSGRTDVSSPCRNAVRRLAGASPVRRCVPGSARRRQAPPAGIRLQVGCRIWRRSPRRSVVQRPPRCCRRVR